MIYFDNAATTEPSEICKQTLKEVFENNWGNPSNLYKIGMDSRGVIEESRETIARCFNCEPDEIFFTSGATESNNWVLTRLGSLSYCTCREHHSILAHPATKDRHMNPDEFIKMLEEEVIPVRLLYSTIFVNNETGEINDIKRIGAVCKECDVIYHVDMTQAAGNVPIDFDEYKDVDFASFSAHKFGGPKGIGILYAEKNAQKYLYPMLFGGAQENNMRAGTENVAYIAAMAKALEEATTADHIKKKSEISSRLRQIIIDTLRENNIDFIVNGDGVLSTLSLSFKGISGEALMMYLSANDIYVGTGSACNTSDLRPSDVLLDMKVPDDYIQGTIRLSFSDKNEEWEAKKTAQLIADYMKEFA